MLKWIESAQIHVKHSPMQPCESLPIKAMCTLDRNSLPIAVLFFLTTIHLLQFSLSLSMPQSSVICLEKKRFHKNKQCYELHIWKYKGMNQKKRFLLCESGISIFRDASHQRLQEGTVVEVENQMLVLNISLECFECW